MKTLNKIFLLTSIALTNGLMHGNGNTYRYLNTATTVGIFVGPIMAIGNKYPKQGTTLYTITKFGTLIFGISIVGKVALYYITDVLHCREMREKKYKLNQELLAVQTKNLEASQAMLKKLEKKETESTVQPELQQN